MAGAHGHGKLQKSVSYIRHPYEDELTAVKPESFFSTQFPLTWITEKELEREIKHKETNFVGGKNKNFCRGGEKMRNASGHRGENERQKSKKREKIE